MSHISHFDSDVRLEESAAVTKSLAKVVRGQDKAALWESCLAQLTPRQRHPSQLISRRISFQPDLQIGVEDEDHAQEIHRKSVIDT